MITNPTRHKLNEAEYFLKMAKSTFENDKEFSYNISAFLSAARSITLYLQTQYTNVAGFLDWYRQRQAQMDADNDLKYLNKARVETIHTVPVRIGAGREVTLKVSVVISLPSEKELEQTKEDYPNDAEHSVPRTVRRFFPDHNNADVVVFCEKQLEKLTKIVDECEQKFVT